MQLILLQHLVHGHEVLLLRLLVFLCELQHALLILPIQEGANLGKRAPHGLQVGKQEEQEGHVEQEEQEDQEDQEDQER